MIYLSSLAKLWYTGRPLWDFSGNNWYSPRLSGYFSDDGPLLQSLRTVGSPSVIHRISEYFHRNNWIKTSYHQCLVVISPYAVITVFPAIVGNFLCCWYERQKQILRSGVYDPSCAWFKQTELNEKVQTYFSYHHRTVCDQYWWNVPTQVVVPAVCCRPP